jgi:putative transposase
MQSATLDLFADAPAADAAETPVVATVHRAYRFRLYPNEAQRVALARTFGCARYVYNWGLARKRDAYRESGKSVGYAALSRELTALRKTKGTEWLGDVLRSGMEQSLRDLDFAYSSFFAGHAAFPRFKRRRGAQSVRYVATAFRVDGTALRLGKTPGAIPVRWSRALPSAPSSCTVSVDAAGRYHASFLCTVAVTPLPSNGRTVGVDLGLTHFATLSTGEKVENPRYLEQKLARLAREQRRLARKVKGSANYGKQKRRVAKVHARIADQRKDFLHKLTTRLIRENQAVAVETLNVAGMVKNRKLARHIGQAGWAEFVRMLDYKAEQYGRAVHRVGRFETTTGLCSACGHRPGKLPLSVRVWTCEMCSAEHDRDVNAAQNIAACVSGHAARNAVSACGDGGSPQRLGAEATVSEAGTGLGAGFR